MAEESQAARLRMDQPANYRIFVQGILDQNWSGRLGGLEITIAAAQEEKLVTKLTGELMDQAALIGVINTLYELHLPLLAVIESDRYEESTIPAEAGE